MSVPGPPPDAPEAAAIRRRQATVMAGLLLTFMGIFLASLLIPVGPRPLDWALLVAAGGLGCLWVGGILLGIGSPRHGRR